MSLRLKRVTPVPAALSSGAPPLGLVGPRRQGQGWSGATARTWSGLWPGVGPCRWRLPGSFALLLFGVLLLSGCGRPATEDDCTLILRRAARLELESRLEQSQGLVESEIRQIEESMRPQMMKQCVGKRITEGALSCVKAAKTSEQLFDECLQ